MRQVATWVAAQVLAICAGTLNSGAAVAAEVLQIPSRNFSDTEFLQGDADKAPPVMLTGRLAVPESEGPVPLVLLLHGSDGPANGSVWNWGNFLGGLGMATLKIDSYTGRGHAEIYTQQARVAEFAPVYDIYRAIEIIADDQRIDPEKIAVMGFSRGGIGALYSSMSRFQDLYGPSHATISAHFPFYPPCNFELERELEVSTAPIRAFHGAADDWNPAPACRAYVDRLKGAGRDALITEYPGAQHSFDNLKAPAHSTIAEAQTSRNCFRREENGVLINTATNEPFSWQDECVQMGPSTFYNDAASTQAQSAVKEFLTELGWLQ